LAVKPAPILTAAQQKLREADDAEDDAEDTNRSSLELVSGSADSTLTFWIDTTATTALQATTQATARIEQDQELQNYIRSNNFREAIVLALQLNHPKRLLELFRTVIEKGNDPGSFTGKLEVDEVLATLSSGQLWNLLRRIRDWNANGRTHHVAQRVLYALLRIYPKKRLLSLQKRRKPIPGDEQENVDEALAGAMAELSTKEKSEESVKDVVDALKAYTERHYTRLEKTGEERFVLLWALGQMDDVSGMKGIENGYFNVEEHEEDVLMLDGA
jgi:U3 small nucleolar RNA-associated protein 13